MTRSPAAPVETASPSQRSSLGFRVWCGEPRAMSATHQHADIELNFVMSGAMRYFIGGRRAIIPPHRLAMLWGGAPHALLEAEPNTQCSWTTIPLAWFLGWALPHELVRRLLRGDLLMDPDDTAAARDELIQREWAAFSATGRSDYASIVRLEVEARVRRFALRELQGVSARLEAHAQNGSAKLAERIAELIGARYTERLSTDAIAEAVGSSPNHVMRVFKRSCGMSIGDYLTGLRVSQAQRLLIETDAKILDIALRSGFGSSTRFYDAFTSVVGQTPSAYRERLQGERSAKPRPSTR